MLDVLIVDDEDYYLWFIRNTLISSGVSILALNNGVSALAALKKSTFKLLITDLNLPGLSGLELAKKSIELNPNMPIILMSPQWMGPVFETAQRIGIKHIINKPFDPIILLDSINSVTMGAIRV